MRRRLVWLVGILVTVPALAVLGSCLRGGADGSDAGSDPTGGATTPSTSSAAPQDLARQYLEVTPPPPVGAAEGDLRTASDATTPARAEVLEVRGTPGSTVLRWRLTVPDEGARLRPGVLTEGGTGDDDTSGIALVSRAADVRALPARYVSEELSLCTCAQMPQRNGPQGVEMSGVYPALPGSVTSVDVEIPGFPPIPAPVRR